MIFTLNSSFHLTRTYPLFHIFSWLFLPVLPDDIKNHFENLQKMRFRLDLQSNLRQMIALHLSCSIWKCGTAHPSFSGSVYRLLSDGLLHPSLHLSLESWCFSLLFMNEICFLFLLKWLFLSNRKSWFSQLFILSFWIF